MSPDITAKENLMTVIRDHKTPAYTPVFMFAAAPVQPNAPIEKGNMVDIPDPFGVQWVWDRNAFGPMPDTRQIVLEDVTEWENVVTFPNADDFDWAKEAETELGFVNRDDHIIEFVSPCGPFERLAALMGFEGALFAMYEEPDATSALLDRITEHKLAVVEKAAEFYKPEMFTMCDDVATARNLFISPEMYEDLIMPCHKRIYAKCKELGILASNHICGKWQPILGLLRQEGVDIISSVQPSNDIAAILRECEDEVAIIGGFDSQGPAGYSSDISIIDAERQRCYDEYGFSKAFVYNSSAMGLKRETDDDGNPLPIEEQFAGFFKRLFEDDAWFRAKGAPSA